MSAGDSGSIMVSVTGANTQRMTIETPNGLPGIPVSEGGNYTDANGQQWFCDEIDLERGVYVKRCARETIIPTYDANNNRYKATLTYGANPNFFVVYGIICVCDKLAFNGRADNGVNGIRVSTNTTNLVIAYYNGEDPGELSLVYPMETPIEIPLSSEELAAYAALRTYKDHTTVSNDAQAYMELEYAMDAKKYIDGLASGTIIPATVE